MKEFFPKNRVEYFVSYYDYYQPEAYIASSDTFIEKDSSVNDEIDRLRHSATAALLTRRDTIVVASVSCIYGMGNPEEYRGNLLELHVGVDYDQRSLLRRLVDLQYDRNDMTLGRGNFRVRGDTIEVQPAYDETVTRIEMFGDTVERITIVDALTGETVNDMSEVLIFPATHYVAGDERMRKAVIGIEHELQVRLKQFETEGKLLEAQRLRMRTQYDLEMIAEVGFCNGIENYSMHIDGRSPGEPPFTLLDYFPDDYLLVVDESHVTIPQLHGQFAGDRSRKATLVEHGFRLPSAADNRPLQFEEAMQRINQCIFLSATPAKFEIATSQQVVEQIVRPTGLVDPEVIRDKDGISAALVLMSIVSDLAADGKTLAEHLDEFSALFGGFVSEQISVRVTDLSAIGALMSSLRQSPPHEIGGIAVKSVEDLAHGVDGLPPSDVIRFWLEDGSRVMVRPSGTEPKLKVYVDVVSHEDNAEERKRDSSTRLEQLSAGMRKIVAL
jgi:excinuclease ABC B subunit